jgi:hypothetical protein
MNFDEFETKMRNVPPGAIPAAWRKEILSVGDSCNSFPQGTVQSGTRITRPSKVGGPWWQHWLWPHPAAWASLAAVWIVIVGLHLATISEPASTSALVRPAPEMLQAFHDRTRLMAELSEELSSAPLPPSPADRPRSGRRLKEAVV